MTSADLPPLWGVTNHQLPQNFRGSSALMGGTLLSEIVKASAYLPRIFRPYGGKLLEATAKASAELPRIFRPHGGKLLEAIAKASAELPQNFRPYGGSS